MNRRSLASLVVINCVLVLVLGVLCLTPRPAQGQLAGGGGDYTMIAGAVPGQTTRTVYVIEINSGRMIAVAYDQNARAIQVQAGRDVAGDVR